MGTVPNGNTEAGDGVRPAKSIASQLRGFEAPSLHLVDDFL
jgi:hypothetical protein